MVAAKVAARHLHTQYLAKLLLLLSFLPLYFLSQPIHLVKLIGDRFEASLLSNRIQQ